MKFIDMQTSSARESVLSELQGGHLFDDGAFSGEKNGKPRIMVKENKGDSVTVRCKMIGGSTVDNGFLEGTYFRGKLTEENGVCRLKGVIITAPIYHAVLFALLIFYVVFSAVNGFFNPIPLIYFVFSFVMFRGEFAKQKIIHTALFRAIRRADASRDGVRGK